MPFRERVKRAFRRTSSSASNNPTTPAPIIRTSTSGATYEVYASDDVPPSKYKGPWNQEHQDRLRAFTFSFDPLGRRRSGMSQYSPGGTRLTSRNPSKNPSRNVSRTPSRAGSLLSVKRKGGPGAGAGSAQHVDQVLEHSEDGGDVGNVGLSRQTSPEASRPRDSLALSRVPSPEQQKHISSIPHPLSRQLSPEGGKENIDPAGTTSTIADITSIPTKQEQPTEIPVSSSSRPQTASSSLSTAKSTTSSTHHHRRDSTSTAPTAMSHHQSLSHSQCIPAQKTGIPTDGSSICGGACGRRDSRSVSIVNDTPFSPDELHKALTTASDRRNGSLRGSISGGGRRKSLIALMR